MVNSTLLGLLEVTLLLSVAALYVVHCPFNKVEESFNTQAVHDIINIFPNDVPYFSPRSYNSTNQIAVRSRLSWDHVENPGPVPRTFIGALLIGLLMKLAKQFILGAFMYDGINVKDDHDFTAQFILQIASRFALSSLVMLSLSYLSNCIQRRYGLAYRLCFLLVSVSQFHYMFYAGRFIPNTYAAILANLIFGSWISRQFSKSVIYIALCVVIFRFDTAIFFGWIPLDGNFIRQFLSLRTVIAIGVPAGITAILISVLVDSVFWGRLVWPELESIYFNVWLNKSHEWGTQPFFWYVYSCLPRLMLASGPLLMLAEHKFTREYLIPVLTFIFTYSILGHKELRFILFITPLLNLCAASGLMNVYHYLNVLFLHLGSRRQQRTKNSEPMPTSRRLNSKRRSRLAIGVFSLVIAGILATNLFACYTLLSISSHNYPGGQAATSLGTSKEFLDAAKQSMDDTLGLKNFRSTVAVYVNNLAAQTGMSRFLQVDGVYYAKTPKLDGQTFLENYKSIYIIIEPQETSSFLIDHCGSKTKSSPNSWLTANDKIKCRLPNQKDMQCAMSDTIEGLHQIDVGALFKGGLIKTRVALYLIRCSITDDDL